MTNNLRVHIAPIGFEAKRVSEPLVKMLADKVYLIKYIHKDNDDATKFYAQIESEITHQDQRIQTVDVLLDVWNLYDCIEKFREIMLQEEGNHIYVNVSTGTKITAIAGMLSCMLWGAEPYYAYVSYDDRIKIKSGPEIVTRWETFPAYSINKPRSEFMLILDMLHRHGGTMKKHQIIKELEEANVIKKTEENGDELSAPAKHSKLRSLLDPMVKEWGLVSVKARGRKSVVSIVPQGETALKIFGLDS